MPINKFYRGGLAGNTSAGTYSSFGVSAEGRLYINRDGTREPIATDHLKVVTADTTLTAEDDGATILIDSATATTITLPAAATCGAGVRFGFIAEQLAASGSHAVSPNSADYIAGNGLNGTKTANKDIQGADAAKAVGDGFRVISDGVDAWWITHIVGTWARET